MGTLAPPAEMVRYLAIFHRAFAVMERYGREEFLAGMLFSTNLANCLHNVPYILTNYDSTGWHTAESMDQWIRGCAASSQESPLPEPIPADSQFIFSELGAAQTLGLQENLSDLDLAPALKLKGYIYLFYWACLEIRVIHHLEVRGRPPWDNLEPVWSAEYHEVGIVYSLVAGVLKQIAWELVHWSQFDEDKFFRDAESLALGQPEARATEFVKLLRFLREAEQHAESREALYL